MDIAGIGNVAVDASTIAAGNTRQSAERASCNSFGPMRGVVHSGKHNASASTDATWEAVDATREAVSNSRWLPV